MSVTIRSSSEELANPEALSREHVVQRLLDWRNRVRELYDVVEKELHGTSVRCYREGKRGPAEELPHRVGLHENDLPESELLRIVRPDDTHAALFYPRGLWIIGANGRIDLRILPLFGSSETYMLVDQSEPFTRPAKWIRMPIGAPFDREPFNPQWLRTKLR